MKLLTVGVVLSVLAWSSNIAKSDEAPYIPYISDAYQNGYFYDRMYQGVCGNVINNTIIPGYMDKVEFSCDRIMVAMNHKNGRVKFSIGGQGENEDFNVIGINPIMNKNIINGKKIDHYRFKLVEFTENVNKTLYQRDVDGTVDIFVNSETMTIEKMVFNFQIIKVLDKPYIVNVRSFEFISKMESDRLNPQSWVQGSDMSS